MAEDAADVWHLLRTDEGQPYYYNRARAVTQWERPAGYVIDAARAAAEAQEAQARQSGTAADNAAFSRALQEAGARIKKHKHATLMKQPRTAAAAAAPAAEEDDNEAKPEDLVRSPLPKARAQSDASSEGGRIKKTASTSSSSSAKKKKEKAAAQNASSASEWVKKKTATVGTGARGSDKGDFFYQNTRTGATQWQRPVDYESDDEIVRNAETSEIAFDTTQPVAAILRELGAAPDSGTAPAIVQDREEMLDGDAAAAKRCARRLRQVLLAVKYCGSAAEWATVVASGDFSLVRDIYLHLGQGGRTPQPVRALTCVLLETFMKLDALLIRRYADGDWGLDPVDFMANVEQGLHECRAARDEGTLFSWLSLCYSFLTQVPRLPPRALPSEDTIELLGRCMTAREEDVFLMAAYAIVALLSHYPFAGGIEGADAAEARETGDEDMSQTLDDAPNDVVRVLQRDAREAELFSEAVVHLLNGCSFPYEDPVLVGQVLYALRALFSTRATREFFHLNDTHVMVDIVIGQVRDLPPEDEFRCDYLRLLHLMIVNSRWHGYKRPEILEALDDVLAAADRGMHPVASKCALRILLDCVRQLS